MSRQNSGFVTINLILFLKKSFRSQQALFRKKALIKESLGMSIISKNQCELLYR